MSDILKYRELSDDVVSKAKEGGDGWSKMSNDHMKAAVRILITKKSDQPANISGMKKDDLVNKLRPYISTAIEETSDEEGGVMMHA